MTHRVNYECVGEDVGQFQDVVDFVKQKRIQLKSSIKEGIVPPKYDIILFDPAGNENAIHNWYANSNVAGCISDYAYSCIDDVTHLNFDYLILKLRPIHSVSALKKILIVASSLRLISVFSNPIDNRQELFLILRKLSPLEHGRFYGLLHHHIIGMFNSSLGKNKYSTLATQSTIELVLQQMHLHFVPSSDERGRNTGGLCVTGADHSVFRRIKNVISARHL
jgi:hypothetical protein